MEKQFLNNKTMKLTKQNCWFMIQTAITAYRIISSCRAPGFEGVIWKNNANVLIPTQQPIFNPIIKTISFTKKDFNLAKGIYEVELRSNGDHGIARMMKG